MSDDLRQGRFRSDLFYRLNVFPLTLPSLRNRQQDIPPLVHHLVKRLSRTLHKRIEIIPTAVIRALQRYDWPGNIRELENVLQRAIILSPDTTLSLMEGWRPSRGSAPSAGLEPLVDLERRHIQRVLEAVHWRIEGKSGAAKVLGMYPSTLRSRMLKLGIQRPRCPHADDLSELRLRD